MLQRRIIWPLRQSRQDSKLSLYLSIIAGAIKLFAAIAQRLQQHHDEMNGAVQQEVKDATSRTKVLENLAGPCSPGESARLWTENKAKFGPADGPSGG